MPDLTDANTTVHASSTPQNLDQTSSSAIEGEKVVSTSNQATSRSNVTFDHQQLKRDFLLKLNDINEAIFNQIQDGQESKDDGDQVIEKLRLENKRLNQEKSALKKKSDRVDGLRAQIHERRGIEERELRQLEEDIDSKDIYIESLQAKIAELKGGDAGMETGYW